MYFDDDRPSYYVYALLSSHVYQDKEESEKWTELQGKGWQIHKSLYGSSSGYFGRVYINQVTKQIVVAHRGTSSLKSALEDVRSIVCGGAGEQRKDVFNIIDIALQFLFDEKNPEFHHLSFTGHSLGAFLADVSVLMAKRIHFEGNYGNNSKAIHISAVTFESPGCKGAWEQMQPKIAMNRIKWQRCDIINFMSYPNAINAFDQPLGTVYLIPIDFDISKLRERTWQNFLSKSKALVSSVIYDNYTYKCHKMTNILRWFRKFAEDSHFEETPVWMMDFPIGCIGHKFSKKFIKFEDNGSIKWERSPFSQENDDISFKDLFRNHFSTAPYNFHRDLALRHFAFQESLKMQEYMKGLTISDIYGGDQKIVQLETKDVIQFRSEFSKWLLQPQGAQGGEYNLNNPPNDGSNDGAYELIDRIQYRALPPKAISTPLRLPIKRVIIAHTATPTCTNKSECAARVLQIQYEHMKTCSDIGYNFLVGGDGRAYEGRGYSVGAHTKEHNEDYLCIAFIGDFNLYEAPEEQLRAAQRIIDDGIEMNKIDPTYILYAHSLLRNFDSPGKMLYKQIKLWPHWSEKKIPL